MLRSGRMPATSGRSRFTLRAVTPRLYGPPGAGVGSGCGDASLALATHLAEVQAPAGNFHGGGLI